MNSLQNYIKNKRVAIIGNAASLIGSGYGQEIEAHDVIVRINMAWPRETVTKDIGFSTHIWVTGGGDATCPWTKEIQQKFKSQFTLGIQQHYSFNPELENLIPLPYSEIVYPLRDKLMILGGKSPSTGCITIEYFKILDGFKELNIYGFDFYKTDDWSYPNPEFKPKLQVYEHENFAIEEKYIKSILNERIKLIG